MNATAMPPTRSSLMQEFDAVVAETEKLLQSVAGASREQADAMRATLAERLNAGEPVRVASWRPSGIAAAGGALAGLLLGAWIARGVRNRTDAVRHKPHAGPSTGEIK